MPACLAEYDDLALLNQVDLACDAFERQWRSGGKPRVEDYLKSNSARLQPIIFRELLDLELEYRFEAGDRPCREELNARFPEWNDEILDALKRAASSTAFVSDLTDEFSLTDDQPVLLGKYELLNEIGRGAFGSVYRARDTELDRLVALKIPVAGLLATSDFRARCNREARAAAQLDHPGIVRVYDLMYVETRPILVSELVDGATLESEITSRGVFGFRSAAQLVTDLAEATHYAHSRGIVHRDLKPSNIILQKSNFQSAVTQPNSEWMARILDFGLARREDGQDTLTQDGQIVGTPAYMSPEQARGEASAIDARSDVYSLGVILFELLTGTKPFRGSLPGLLQQIASAPVPSLRRLNRMIPRDLCTICNKCLEKDVNCRYSSAAELATDLRCWLAGCPIYARSVSLAERTWLWCARNPRRAIALSTATALGLILCIALLWQQIHLRTSRKLVVEELLNRLQNGPAAEVRAVINAIHDLPEAHDQLRILANDETASHRTRTRANLALLPFDPDSIQSVLDSLLKSDVAELLIALDEMTERRHDLEPKLAEVLVKGTDMERLRAACILGCWRPKDNRLTEQADFLSSRLLAEAENDLDGWLTAIKPFEECLIDPLTRLFSTSDSHSADRVVACKLLIQLLRDRPSDLVSLLNDPDTEQRRMLVEAMRQRRERVRSFLQRMLHSAPVSFRENQLGEQVARAQANAAIALVAARDEQGVQFALADRPDPRLRSYFIEGAASSGIPLSVLVDRLEVEQDPGALYGLLLCLGNYPSSELTQPLRERLEKWLVHAFSNHADAGVHSAAGWVLHRHGRTPLVNSTTDDLKSKGPVPGRNWYVNSLGMLMVVVYPSEPFMLGCPDDEPGHHPFEVEQPCRIGWSYAISATEVTRDQFAQFSPTHTHVSGIGGTGAAPVSEISWQQAAAFCAWLSEQENLQAAESIDPTNPNQMTVQLDKPGYRLPSNAEWEFACRAGTRTSRFFGTLRTLHAANYAWFSPEQRLSPAGALMPNRLGLHDLYGNVHEWICSLHKQPFVDLAPSAFLIRSGDLVDIRGGAYNERDGNFRSARRTPFVANDDNRMATIGFRVSRTIQWSPQ